MGRNSREDGPGRFQVQAITGPQSCLAFSKQFRPQLPFHRLPSAQSLLWPQEAEGLLEKSCASPTGFKSLRKTQLNITPDTKPWSSWRLALSLCCWRQSGAGNYLKRSKISKPRRNSQRPFPYTKPRDIATPFPPLRRSKPTDGLNIPFWPTCT